MGPETNEGISVNEGSGRLEGEDEEGHRNDEGECRSDLMRVSDKGPEGGAGSSGDLAVCETCIGGWNEESFYKRGQLNALEPSGQRREGHDAGVGANIMEINTHLGLKSTTGTADHQIGFNRVWFQPHTEARTLITYQ